MNLQDITDFIYDQKRVNFELKTSLKDAQERLNLGQAGGGNPLEAEMTRLDTHKRMNREIDQILKDIKEVSSRVVVAQKDLLSFREIQKSLQTDVNDLRIEQAAKFRAKNYTLENPISSQPGPGLGNSGSSGGLQNEIMSIRIQHESLFEKSNMNYEGVKKLEKRIEEALEKLTSDQHRNNLQMDVNNRFNALEINLEKLREEFDKKVYNIKLELKNLKLLSQDDPAFDNYGPLDVYNPGNEKSEILPSGVSSARRGVRNDAVSLGTAKVRTVDQVRAIVAKEMEHLYNFVHQYVDEIGVYWIERVRGDEHGTDAKMEGLDWFARNVDFVTPK